MFYYHVLISKHPKLSQPEFTSYWTDVHGPKVRSAFQSCGFPVAYRQCHRLESVLNTAPYDGIADGIYGTRGDVHAAEDVPGFQDEVPNDEPHFMNLSQLQWMCCEVSLVHTKQTYGATKWVQFLRRSTSTTVEQFHRQLLAKTEPLKDLPGMQRIELSRTLQDTYGLASPPWDAIVSTYVANVEAAEIANDSEAANRWYQGLVDFAEPSRTSMVCSDRWMWNDLSVFPPNASDNPDGWGRTKGEV